MAGGEAAFLEKILDRRFEFQEADGVGNRGPIFSGAFGDLFLGELKFVNKTLKCVGLFDRVEIFALKILDEGHFEGQLFGHVAKNDRNVVKIGTLGGAPAAFASNQLVAIRDLTYDKRLNDSARLYGARKFVESLLAEAGARLVGARVDQVNGNVQETFTQRRGYRRCRCRGSQWVGCCCRHRLQRLRRRCCLRLPNQCSQSPA